MARSQRHRARRCVAIKRAIQSGKFFIACFSREYNKRERTHMSEEITIAIDELRIRPSERTWFIPVLINKTNIPSRPISSVEDLSDMNAVKLYENWNAGINKILRVLMYDDPVLSRVCYLLDINERPFDNERLHAIRELGAIGAAAKPALFTLIKAAKENNIEIQKASLEALGKIGPDAIEAVPVLAAALNDPDVGVRRFAAEALGEIGSGSVEAVSALAAALKVPATGHCGPYRDGDPAEEGVRRSAAEALGRIGSEAVPVLAAALKDPKYYVRRIAAFTLGDIGPDAVEAVPAIAAALNAPKG